MYKLRRGVFVRLKPDAALRCGFIFGRVVKAFDDAVHILGNPKSDGPWYVGRDEISRVYEVSP
jgi:hypothetical protein